MHFLLFPVLMLLMYSDESVAHTIHQPSTEHQSILSSIQDDLKMLNVSCEASDSCERKRIHDSLDYFGCHCGPYCVQLDTCCLDSPYIAVRKPKMRPSCRSAYNGGRFFMVDRCPASDSRWSSLCEEEWNGEDDIFRIMPVTSRQTLITYKNYFCLKCYERNEDFVHWTIRYDSNALISERYNATDERLSIKYDISQETWMAVIGEDNAVSFPVNISMEAPENIRTLVQKCEMDLISRCSEQWTDKDVQDKCEAYTAMKLIFRDGKTFAYRNTHCAKCNFETIHELVCITKVSALALGKDFSLRNTLDVNPKDGDGLVKIKKCDEDNVWDPFFKKCRKQSCVIPGQIVRNGKCVAE